jgi:predicted N-acyltransferase
MAAVRVRVLQSIAEVDARAWDALLDANATPFVRWAWLEAMERSGCASARAGWTPSHLTIWKGETLIAAAPAYLKEDSEGDFSRDWGWASGAMNAGIAYYPKLIVTVPFTPVTGRRLLIAPGEDRPALAKRLVDAARALAKEQGLATVQVLFPDAEDLALLEAAEMHPRVDFQYHWFNAGYAAPDDFLARFTSKHRNMLKRERRAPTEQGISVRTVRGEELAQDPARFAKLAHTFHRTTVDKLMWGRRWLNEKFYQHAFAGMPQHMELVLAERDGRPIAGAFNVADGERLFGRYWGCLEEHPFLHFNVCYYHSIDECIRRGVKVFEGGAGGEHKVARGFEPSPTYSAHAFLDSRLERAMAHHLAEETAQREAALEGWRRDSPLFKRASPQGAA